MCGALTGSGGETLLGKSGEREGKPIEDSFDCRGGEVRVTPLLWRAFKEISDPDRLRARSEAFVSSNAEASDDVEMFAKGPGAGEAAFEDVVCWLAGDSSRTGRIPCMSSDKPIDASDCCWCC